MWFFDLVDLVTGRFAVPVLLTLAIALAVGCFVALQKSEAARRASVSAGISPLWPLVPFLALFFTSPLGTDLTGPEFLVTFLTWLPSKMWLLMQMVFLAAQVVLSVIVVRRHRAWPWLVWPLTIVLALLAAAIVVTDAAMIAGPLVK